MRNRARGGGAFSASPDHAKKGVKESRPNPRPSRRTPRNRPSSPAPDHRQRIAPREESCTWRGRTLETIRGLVEAGEFFLKSFHATSTRMLRKGKLSLREANGWVGTAGWTLCTRITAKASNRVVTGTRLTLPDVEAAHGGSNGV
jgi:hypothetical protein